MRLLFVIITFGVFGSECFAKFIPHSLSRTDSQSFTTITDVDKINYTIGEKQNCYVGNEIIQVDKYKNIIVQTEYGIVETQYKSLTNYKDIKKDKIYRIEGKVPKQDELFLNLYEDSIGKKYLLIDSNGKVADEELQDLNHKVVVKDYISEELRDSKLFEAVQIMSKPSKIEKKSTIKGSSYSLIYNGKNSNVIKIQYREFIDDISRPAFYQELLYDLKESKYIRFQNFKIEVLKSTNEEIEFIVLEDGNKKVK